MEIDCLYGIEIGTQGDNSGRGGDRPTYTSRRNVGVGIKRLAGKVTYQERDDTNAMKSRGAHGIFSQGKL